MREGGEGEGEGGQEGFSNSGEPTNFKLWTEHSKSLAFQPLFLSGKFFFFFFLFYRKFANKGGDIFFLEKKINYIYI